MLSLNTKIRMSFTVFILIFLHQFSYARIQPGFNPDELRTLINISVRQGDTPWVNMRYAYPQGYKMIYRSSVVALDNRWDLWSTPDSGCVISIRGTTSTNESWLENFYAGMIPAIGSLPLANNTTFNYQLAADSNSYIHIGWMIGLAYMAPDIVAKINEQYKNGKREFRIMGHSQGGAIALLLHAYLHFQKGKNIPDDVVLKTYATAAPKPGNQNFAYNFDFITRGGWAFRVVNSADWVAEVPFSIQTLNDIHPLNPFYNALHVKGFLKWPLSSYAKHVIRKMNRAAKRSQKRYKKYLGKKAGKMVRKTIKGMPKHALAPSMHYVACGSPVILYADADYFREFPNDQKKIFRHHWFGPYVYLLNRYYPKS
ncbi:MAG: hypothetical protein Fur0041_06010 [Bacteroidia bacterium]